MRVYSIAEVPADVLYDVNKRTGESLYSTNYTFVAVDMHDSSALRRLFPNATILDGGHYSDSEFMYALIKA